MSLIIEYVEDLDDRTLDEIIDILDRADIDAEVRPAVYRGGSHLGLWTILVVAPTVTYLNAVIQEAAKESFSALLKVMRRARRLNDGSPILVLTVADGQVFFSFTGDTPVTARRALSRMICTQPIRPGRYQWDSAPGKWRRQPLDPAE
jgi:hypothetical protein